MTTETPLLNRLDAQADVALPCGTARVTMQDAAAEIRRLIAENANIRAGLRPDDWVEEGERIRAQFMGMEAHAMNQKDEIRRLLDVIRHAHNSLVIGVKREGVIAELEAVLPQEQP